MGDIKTIGFIGFGNMARAVAGGILGAKLAQRCELIAYNPTREKITSFAGVRACDDSREVAQSADYLFLCVKPQQLEAAFGEFNDMLRNGQIVVSIAAGVSVERLLKMAKKDVKIVRTMPNTPLLVGCGATAISRPKEISDADYDFVCEIFRSSGDIFEIAPDKFDEVIPVAGSGVAILFRLARLIAESAEREGLDYDSSINMFAKTLEGAAAMIFRSGKPADELEKMVCSKGGTTLALLGKLDEFEFNRAVNEAYGACVARAKELGKQV